MCSVYAQVRCIVWGYCAMYSMLSCVCTSVIVTVCIQSLIFTAPPLALSLSLSLSLFLTHTHTHTQTYTHRSMSHLTLLNKLDLGNNEFVTMVGICIYSRTDVTCIMTSSKASVWGNMQCTVMYIILTTTHTHTHTHTTHTHTSPL